MNWKPGNGTHVANCGSYRITRLVSPEYQFAAIWHTSLSTETTLAACPTEEEAKAACESHAKGEA